MSSFNTTNLNNLFLTTTQEILSFKKIIFGFDPTTVIQKIAFAFFLDNAQKQLPHSQREASILLKDQLEKKEICSCAEDEIFTDLQKYEWSGGSLTSKRFGEELSAFLCSPHAKVLNIHTIKVLKELSSLFHETSIQEEIDLIRSNYLSLVLLAKTGSLFWLRLEEIRDSIMGNTSFTAEHISHLTKLTVDKIKKLKVGEKAIFPAGSLIHETLICIDLKEDESYELCYYDTDSKTTALYRFGLQALINEELWKTLYTCKLMLPGPLKSTKNSEQLIDDYAKAGNGKNIPYPSHIKLPSQDKNTCHLMCLLACLKDHIVRDSPLELSETLLEWTFFKRQFGIFLLNSGLLQDPMLVQLAHIKQKQRDQKSVIEKLFLSCIPKETINDYIKLLKSISPSSEYIVQMNNPFNTLKKLHKKVVETLEDQLITPQELKQTFQFFDNPCLRETFSMFCDRFDRRLKMFNQSLSKELEFNPINYLNNIIDMANSALPLQIPIVGDYQTIPYIAPIETERLFSLLNSFETDPQTLTCLISKPSIRLLLLQAIQMGQIGKVEAILQKLPQRDQEEFYICCANFSFSPIILPDSIDEYIEKNPDNKLALSLQSGFIEKAFVQGKSEKILQIKKMTEMAFEYLDKYTRANRLSEQEIHAILSCIQALPIKRQESFTITALLSKITQSLLYNFELLEKMKKYKIHDWDTMLEPV